MSVPAIDAQSQERDYSSAEAPAEQHKGLTDTPARKSVSSGTQECLCGNAVPRREWTGGVRDVLCARLCSQRNHRGAMGWKGWQGRGGATLCVNDQPECMELHASMGMDEELMGSLWVRIKGRTGTGDIVVGVCCWPPDQEDWVDEAIDRQEQPHIHQPWASWETSLQSLGGTTQPGISITCKVLWWLLLAWLLQLLGKVIMQTHCSSASLVQFCVSNRICAFLTFLSSCYLWVIVPKVWYWL